MEASGGATRGRLRWAALFALLLLASSAVPVLADELVPGGSSESPDFVPSSSEEQEVAASQIPGAEDVSKALAEYERERAERERWLATPEAVGQREASRLAFGELSPGESQDLLRTLFAEQIGALEGDPSRTLADSRLIADPSGPGAVVKEEGERELLESSIPVRTEDEDGDLSKVDLSLRATPQGYETANALADLRLPQTAGGRVSVGKEGVAIGQAGAASHSALRVGDTDLFYPEVLPDTDLFVAPGSFGVELFDLLRSEESPETFSFEVEVPDGAELRSDGRGGAEIVRGEQVLTQIPKPWAIDAQGSEVDLQTAVRGAELQLSVPHRAGDYAYPILVDPIVEDWVNENWYNGHHWDVLTNGAWQWTSNNSNIHDEVCCWEGSHAGLMTVVESVFYGPEQFGQWAYTTGNEKVYITHAWLIPFNRADNGCGSQQPHDYVGLWNPGSEQWIPLQTERAKNYGNASFDGYGKALVLGLGTGPPGVWLACDRVLYSGGVAIWLNDDWGPGVSYAGVPSGKWIGDQEKTDITVHSWDEGLGVQFVKLNPDGRPAAVVEHVEGCTGLYGARCPTDHESHFEMTGDSLGPGIRESSVTVSDPTGKTAESFFTTKVDNAKPQVALEGQLAEATKTKVGFTEGEPDQTKGDDELSLPVYNLHIRAKDGSLASNLEKQSGVKDIRVKLDGKEMKVPWQPLASCPETSCERDVVYPLDLTEIETGDTHDLEVIAEDFVGEEKERHIEFQYIPATGMKDEYVMHYFPLSDGQGSEEEEEHPARPELAVNVMNGNLVYRQRDIDVEGPAVDLEVERFYNSQLPESENTEWGDGWTLAQTPKLEPEFEESSPISASMVQTSGAIQSAIGLPTGSGEAMFDAELQATITKEPGGGYSVQDESGETENSLVFDGSGKVTEERTPGYAKVDYDYEEGKLAEIAVKDPGSAGAPTDPPEGEGEYEEAEEAGATPVYEAAFGSYGSEDGQLKSPGDVAVDSNGDVWVADKANNRIEHFDPAGNFLSKFGTVGSGNGQLNIPTSLTIDAEGDIWVTERGNNRVQKFSPSGEYLAKFGSYGTANGQFHGPEGIAIDAQGDVWVSDTYGGRVQEFDPEGNFLQVVGSYGSGEGQIGEPTGIDVDAEGNVWIADWQNNRVETFDSEGNFIRQFGSSGTGDGQFNRPDALDVDAKGNVWVGDQNNGRIQRFDLEGDYVDQFGSKGSGEGQFSFTYPMGIEADAKGNVWIADVNNNRIQRWKIPGSAELFTAYGESLGSAGSGEGQLEAPADAVVDDEGGLWVTDRGNDRIVHFDPQGELASQFGSTGSGDGQLNAPSGIDIDPEGNLWVADTGNDRIQKFSPQGEFLLKLGSSGSGNGQFSGPVGIAYAPNLPFGALYVADRGNNRIELFGKGGGYIGQAGTYGSGEKQLIEPSSIALGGPFGESPVTLLIADSGNHRIQRWKWAGGFVNQFGTLGTGKGQFNRPEALDVDEQGTVWVGDRVNDRVEAFDEEGNSLGEFGGPGTGEGQFELTQPIGIAATLGEVWVTDSGNDRLQRWSGFMHSSGGEAAPIPEDDPQVDISTTSGLVSSVSGEKAGTHTYSHEGNDLTAYSGPEGETDYEYDAEGRMTKVTLPNGTWGQIAYFEDGRVKSVTVDPAGEEPAKTTHFTYKDDSPRRTTVEPADSPQVVYDIGDDGSVLKWWNVQQPPELDLGGNLYDNRNEDGALWPGLYLLEVEALSDEGVSSIEVILEGDTLVSEKTCEQDFEVEGKECLKEEDEWVAETDQLTPGHLQIEVVATDSEGMSSSERFWVDIPEPPPPLAPGTPVEPKFRDILKFREEYGLEKVFPVKGERELNERIFNLIKAWNEPNTPAGEVARASMDRWGVPLRPQDVAELEYRDWYIGVNGPLIDEWGYANHSNTYAGYTVDHRAGGIIRVGFTQDQEQRVSELSQQPGLVATDRLGAFTTVPLRSRESLENLETDMVAAMDADPQLSAAVSDFNVSDANNAVSVEASNVAVVEERLAQIFGGLATNFSVDYQPDQGELQGGRDRQGGRMLAGDRLWTDWEPTALSPLFTWGTAGFGAYESVYGSQQNQVRYNKFLLAAGHMGAVGTLMYRFANPAVGMKRSDGVKIGRVDRVATEGYGRVDALAMRFNSGSLMPYYIFGNGGNRPPVRRAGVARRGEFLCVSGARTEEVKCGRVTRVGYHKFPEAERATAVLTVYGLATRKGDSGAPVWHPRNGGAIAVGIVSGGYEQGKTSYVQPLRDTPKGRGKTIPGALADPHMGNLNIASVK